MSAKSSKDDLAEVSSARNRLDGVLQNLAEQRDTDDVLDREEELLEPDLEVEIEEFVVGPSSGPLSEASYSPLGSPFRRSPRSGGKSNRKRARGLEEFMSPEFQQQNNQQLKGLNWSLLEFTYRLECYVMKLFDRSVDLAKFSEDSPLYPVCRAWFKNESGPFPAADFQSETDSIANSETELSQVMGVYNLPTPCLVKQEADNLIDIRVPSPLPQSDEQLDIHADPNLAPEADMLLLNHMMRWKQVRLRWKNASRQNEMQYEESLKIIKELYERQSEKQNYQ